MNKEVWAYAEKIGQQDINLVALCFLSIVIPCCLILYAFGLFRASLLCGVSLLGLLLENIPLP